MPSPKWLVIVNNQQKKKRRFEASSPSNMEFEHLEDYDALQVPIVNLERLPGVKVGKKYIEETKVQRRYDFSQRRCTECYDGRKKKNE